MIEIRGVTKRYRSGLAVDGVSFIAPPASITGFLGPNGAGKTTTLRVLLGLARPDSGEALINGARYPDLDSPRRAVGAVIDSVGFHPGRTGRNHLRVIARAAGISQTRVSAVLEFVDLIDAADQKVGGYSQGMRQRLALAAALLGDPPVLVLDEPTNGLDPAGMIWLRRLLVDWAAQGRTVLFSSHILSEVEMIADRVVIIDRGQIVRQGTAAELYENQRAVVVRSSNSARLAEIADREGWRVRHDGGERLVIHGASSSEIGAVAAREQIVLSELSSETNVGHLEDLFFEFTGSNEEK